MELIAGLEPATSSLPRKCSTSEPYEQTYNCPQLLFNNTIDNDLNKKADCIYYVYAKKQHVCIKYKTAPSLNGAGNRTRTGDPQLGRLTL